MLKNWTGTIAIITFLLVGSSTVSAEGQNADHEVFAFLKEAFQTQLSLGERHHSMGEIEELLNPYFAKEYQENFLKEHLFEEKEGFITYGTDFPAYYIPFFSYTDETKVLEEDNGALTVYEFFPSEDDMPSLYDDHYEFVKLVKSESGWKVVEYGFEYEEPDFIEGIASVSKKNSNDFGTINHDAILTSLFSFGFIVNPFNHHSYTLSAPLKATALLQERQVQSFVVTR